MIFLVMYNHEPQWYICPFCRVVAGIEDDRVITRKQDIVYQDDLVIAFIWSHRRPNNHGSVIIIPRHHVENLYDMNNELLSYIHIVAKKIAIAFKEVYGCDWVSTRQHNEPSGNQDVRHYHFHVIPRYANDDLYVRHLEKFQTTPEQRWEYAQKLKKYFTASLDLLFLYNWFESWSNELTI